MRWLLCLSICLSGSVVVDEDGRPVAGAIVAASPRRITTAAGGSFVLHDQRSPYVVFHPGFQPVIVPPNAERIVLTTLETARALPPCRGQVIEAGDVGVYQASGVKMLFIGHGERHSSVHYSSAALRVMVMHREDEVLYFSMPSDLPIQVWKAKSQTGLITRGKNSAGEYWAWIGDLGQSSLFAKSTSSQPIDHLLDSLCAL